MTKEKATLKRDRKSTTVNMKDKSAMIKGGRNKRKRKKLALVSKVGPDTYPNNTSNDSMISVESTIDNENEEWEVAVPLPSSTVRTGKGKQKTEKKSVKKKEKPSILCIFIFCYLLLISYNVIFYLRDFSYIYVIGIVHLQLLLLRNRG